MACSYAQFEANRRNAMRSTGPRTPQGKAVSRQNGQKHGLTGAGIVIPTEDAEAMDQRFQKLEAEMKPKNEIARQLVLRIALLNVRLERSAEHESKAIAHRMRQAEVAFDDERLAEAENHMLWIAVEPATNARRLRNSPEGTTLLIQGFQGMLDDLRHPSGSRWDWQRSEKIHHMMGLKLTDVPVSRVRALSEAIEGKFQYLEADDAPDLSNKDRQAWAVQTLAELIESEIAKLRALLERFDLEGLAIDRAEAAQRAIFDPSKEAILARKYEAATERSLYKALQEFRAVQAEATESDSQKEFTSDPIDEMGSSWNDPPGEAVEAADNDPIIAEGGDPGPSAGPKAGSNGRSRRNRPDLRAKRGR